MLDAIKKQMAQTQPNQIKQPVKTKGRVNRYIKLLLLLAIVATAFYGVYKINQFFESNKLVFQKPISINFFAPVYVTKREKIQVVKVVEQIKSNTPLNEIQQYICDKFGSDCKTALAVSRAENGTMQCDRFNINSNGTVDFGVFQINTIHLKKGYKISDLIDCKKNVDIAYEIYSQQKGFQAWVAYNNGNYKKFLY